MQETTEKKEIVKQYFKKCFDKKLLIQKGIIAAIALAIVLIFSVSFYCWLKDVPAGDIIGQNDFWYIKVDWNWRGGLGGNLSTPAIFGLQSTMFVLLLAIYLIVSHDKITSSFVALAMFGGLFNLIQRAADTHTIKSVLDYFTFGPWIKFEYIFNWPDIFVVVGIFGFVISYITLTIIQYTRESKAEKANQKAKDEQPKQY